MNVCIRATIRVAAAGAILAVAGYSQGLPPALKSKVEAKVKQLSAWGTDAAVVSAVKAHNSAPPPEAKAMTQDVWKGLSVLDPTVRALTKNPVAAYLKSKKDDTISEAFVSGADGAKVAFLSKPTNWSHKGKPKHDVPMSGRTWIGPLEVDESAGVQEVQVSFPVLDGGKAIGSIVVGLKAASL